MATVYSGEVAVGSYNRIRIKCDYSGSSATLTIQFRRTSSYTATWSDSNATLTFNGQSKGAAYSYSGTVGTSWVNLRAAISGYTISTSGGTYNWTFNNPGGSSVLGCSGTITIPSQGSKPSNGHIDNPNSTYTSNGVQINADMVGVADGGLSLTSRYFYISESAYTSSVPALRIQFTNNDSIYINQNNAIVRSSTGGIVLQFNKLYYTALFASNSAGDYTYQGPTVVSVPAPSSFYLYEANENNVVIGYNTNANPGEYSTEELQYSFDNINWEVATTVKTDDDYSGKFTINGIPSNTTRTIYFRVVTPAGYTPSGSFTFTTKQVKTTKMYGSPASKNLYYINGPTSSTHNINTTNNSNGLSNTFYGTADATCYPRFTVPNPYKINVEAGKTYIMSLSSPAPYSVAFRTTNHNQRLMNINAGETVSNSWTATENDTGWAFLTVPNGQSINWTVSIQVEEGSVATDFVKATAFANSKQIFKIYGPVNGDAKSIVKLYGSVDGRAKLIYKER